MRLNCFHERRFDVILTLLLRRRGSVLKVYMMTSSNGNIFRVTGPLCGEFTGPGEFPAQRPVTRSFDVFFDLRPNKQLSKQPRGWWFETPSWSLWRQRNEYGPCTISNSISLIAWMIPSLPGAGDLPGDRRQWLSLFYRVWRVTAQWRRYCRYLQYDASLFWNGGDTRITGQNQGPVSI